MTTERPHNHPSPSAEREAIRAQINRERIEQGLPFYIEDEGALRRLAALLDDARRRRRKQAGS